MLVFHPGVETGTGDISSNLSVSMQGLGLLLCCLTYWKSTGQGAASGTRSGVALNWDVTDGAFLSLQHISPSCAVNAVLSQE